MHKEILTENQLTLLPLVKNFSKNFYLVGGTAIGLHIGHRRSLDFDLFTGKKFGSLRIKNQIEKFEKIDKVIINELGEYSLIVKGVKLTFLEYPFEVKAEHRFDQIIKMPDLLTLSALKAYALGRRAKWKDYVDLYFVMANHYSIIEIIKMTKDIFGKEFNEKNFRAALVYFKDIDYSEKVDFLSNYKIADNNIKKGLINFSTQF